MRPFHPRLLTASHVKDWSKCESDFERLDPNNGLLLCPNHDRVFDNKLISFDNPGNILISSLLSEEDRMFLNLNENQKIELLSEKRVYMAWHRDAYGYDK
ncbi:HNH endonuclease [Paenibacillus alginolyticus]|uniref:HNH endonuclease n=1 Tax=Paenibacillus alginolyticus TaxID=59839 RepID=UPI000422CEC2|nr:HNH endonuclease signature motif containing protein [Paenibacillus alginolyticus]